MRSLPSLITLFPTASIPLRYAEGGGLNHYQGFAGDGEQRPLVPRSRSSPRLKLGVWLQKEKTDETLRRPGDRASHSDDPRPLCPRVTAGSCRAAASAGPADRFSRAELPAGCLCAHALARCVPARACPPPAPA